MTNAELKKYITTGSLLDTFLIMQCEDDFFLAEQYIAEICNRRGMTKVVVDNLDATVQSSMDLLFSAGSNLFVIKTDKFDENKPSYDQYTNTIVLCHKILDKVAKKTSNYIVKIPKPQEWATKAYMQYYCSGLSSEYIDWLYKATGGNMYRACAEMDKLNMFADADKDKVLLDLINSPNSDLYSDTVFTYVDALFKHDIHTVSNILSHRDYCDLEPVGIVRLLLNKYRGALLATNTNCTAKDIGISPAQLGYFSKSFRGIDPELCAEKIRFLSSIDSRLKLGKLELSKDRFLDYITCNILA